ncbi:MAG: rhamnogalacturonan acetylesterase [Chitinophagaceae bacterium]
MKPRRSFIVVLPRSADPLRKFLPALLFLCVACLSLAWLCPQKKPVLYIIGDSTVRNGNGTGSDSLWGWASLVDPYFDTSRIGIDNRALGGRSSRTFITEGRWDKIMQTLQPGDFVLMQFGHNDAGPLDDTARARGTIRGIGNESREIYNPIRRQPETVYTYGWYLRKYVNDTKSKGAIPIICSPVPRDNWKDGRVMRADTTYALWARQIAVETGTLFIDLNQLIADRYEQLGQQAVSGFFPKDHTHTNRQGAALNAATVAGALRQSDGELKKYLNN